MFNCIAFLNTMWRAGGDVGVLQCRVCRRKRLVYLGLGLLCAVNQPHHLADEYVALAVHQFKADLGQLQRVFEHYQVSLGGVYHLAPCCKKV